MPKAWRECSLCPNNSYSSEPDLVIFQTENKDGPIFVCEKHYLPEEMRVHGISKRFVRHHLPLTCLPKNWQNLAWLILV